MSSSYQKRNRLLDIFCRAMRGERLSVKKIADDYEVSTRSITRDLNEIKNFLSECRDIVGSAELKYDAAEKVYYLNMEGFLLSKEMIAMIKMMIGVRGFSKMELLNIVSKLKSFMSYQDQKLVANLISNEMYHYSNIHHDCESVVDMIWKLTGCIEKQVVISIDYYKMSRESVTRKIKPVAIIFSEYYYYLIAYRYEGNELAYFRIDRITKIVEHREKFSKDVSMQFSEGELRNKIQFMTPGKEQKIRFSFSGPSLQAILDKLPTAKVVERNGNEVIIEAVTYGDGIKMFLLSQGSWIKVLGPESFLEEMKEEISKLYKQYN